MAGTLKTYAFKVEMTCEGCSKAVSNVLSKHKGMEVKTLKKSLNINDQGINKFDIDLKESKVTVETTLPLDKVIEILQKTGKKVTPLDN